MTRERAPCTADTRACDFWSWGIGHNRPDCCTAHLLELAAFTHDLLERHGFVHWIDFGTLLGAVRGGELVPWDTDVDFGAYGADEAAIRALEPEIVAAGYNLARNVPSIVRIELSKVNELRVDVMLWDELDGRLWTDDDLIFGWPGMDRNSFPASYVADLESVRLHGRPFPVPSPVHPFLRDYRYGADYLTPRREPHTHTLLPPLGLEDMTPTVTGLIDRIATLDARRLELERTQLSRYRICRAWQTAGLPLVPEAKFVDRVLEEFGSTEQTAALGSLVRSAALLEQAIDELEHGRVMLAVRKGYRRAVRARELVAARREGRPHRASFPFGAPVRRGPEPRPPAL